MTAERNILLGRIVKTLGFDGTLVLRSESDYPGKIKDIESVFLIIEGKPVPFFIEYMERRAPGSLTVRFEGYESPEAVKELLGSEVWAKPPVKTIQLPDHSFNLTGYSVYSVRKEHIGIVTEMVHYPGQILIKVEGSNKKEYLIPFHEELLINLNDSEKNLVIEIPEGLLEI